DKHAVALSTQKPGIGGPHKTRSRIADEWKVVAERGRIKNKIRKTSRWLAGGKVSPPDQSSDRVVVHSGKNRKIRKSQTAFVTDHPHRRAGRKPGHIHVQQSALIVDRISIPPPRRRGIRSAPTEVI